MCKPTFNEKYEMTDEMYRNAYYARDRAREAEATALADNRQLKGGNKGRHTKQVLKPAQTARENAVAVLEGIPNPYNPVGFLWMLYQELENRVNEEESDIADALEKITDGYGYYAYEQHAKSVEARKQYGKLLATFKRVVEVHIDDPVGAIVEFGARVKRLQRRVLRSSYPSGLFSSNAFATAENLAKAEVAEDLNKDYGTVSGLPLRLEADEYLLDAFQASIALGQECRIMEFVW